MDELLTHPALISGGDPGDCPGFPVYHASDLFVIARRLLAHAPDAWYSTSG